MEPEPKNSITLINCGTSLHLDFWNNTKEQYTNTSTFGTQLIKINGIAEPLSKKIKTLGPLEPTKNNE